ncbi:50S ribosomal protein L18e [Candidatus Micrarchaeota archaeon CG08_land_8_20_14_0_20_49_17]|nr:MAG: hypothetical protein AUJ13_04680 [Candidatus Micrarchaeota archaeon CG1_02_49_24]PIU09297.1 MAG: 50S ribosomal protein L18e [Candidatus Micrarchaeota archaeon CG08_land_8_20_14_0_20_49_17]PIU81349.1 MAG: 50S ribosomal protein L18e [Candidatus Micrarchaeota archaeon CG06_land_8_20_14_3_00_50_6]PIZ94728.1 MAG: 50S ribosomal protein L18e [Candidatus Micrarchaeota archaeon CG_4_10_14_0_2_um_filter_49_7]HII53989.1 50S ribosomal protein L18e [Candidatus Micrarchaeota archaeon]
MALKIKSDNIVKKGEIISLVKRKLGAGRRLAALLNRPKRKGAGVNLWKIGKNSKQGDVVAVPGKVLSAGELSHSVTVAAFAFSAGAKQKLEKAGCKCIALSQLGEKELKAAKIII